MTTMSCTICVDRDSLLRKSPSYVEKHSRRATVTDSDDSELAATLGTRIDSSNVSPISDTERISSSIAHLSDAENESIAQSVKECLRSHAYRELRSLSCEFCNGIVTLRGEVTTYFNKQLAQESVRRLASVEVIINAVAVLATNQSDPCPSMLSEDSRSFPKENQMASQMLGDETCCH